MIVAVHPPHIVCHRQETGLSLFIDSYTQQDTYISQAPPRLGAARSVLTATRGSRLAIRHVQSH